MFESNQWPYKIWNVQEQIYQYGLILRYSIAYIYVKKNVQ